MVQEKEPILIEKPKRKRRTKAEIAAAHAKEEEERSSKAAAKVREEMKLGKTLKAKVASAILAAIGDNWTQIECDGKIADISVSVYQPADDLNTVKVRLTSRYQFINRQTI